MRYFFPPSFLHTPPSCCSCPKFNFQNSATCQLHALTFPGLLLASWQNVKPVQAGHQPRPDSTSLMGGTSQCKNSKLLVNVNQRFQTELHKVIFPKWIIGANIRSELLWQGFLTLGLGKNNFIEDLHSCQFVHSPWLR